MKRCDEDLLWRCLDGRFSDRLGIVGASSMLWRRCLEMAQSYDMGDLLGVVFVPSIALHWAHGWKRL
jgi:hypothetical protein